MCALLLVIFRTGMLAEAETPPSALRSPPYQRQGTSEEVANFYTKVLGNLCQALLRSLSPPTLQLLHGARDKHQVDQHPQHHPSYGARAVQVLKETKVLACNVEITTTCSHSLRLTRHIAQGPSQRLAHLLPRAAPNEALSTCAHVLERANYELSVTSQRQIKQFVAPLNGFNANWNNLESYTWIETLRSIYTLIPSDGPAADSFICFKLRSVWIIRTGD